MSANKKKSGFKKRKNKQSFLIGAIMVTATLLAAVIVVYFTADLKPASVEISSEPPSSDGFEEIMSSTLESIPTSSELEAITSSTVQKAPKYPSITGDGDYALTDEEIAEIEGIITKAEAEVYYTPSSDDTSSESSSKPSSDASSKSGVSSREQKPPPQRRSISIYFEDIQSGYSYSYNADRKYFIASLIKAPYCMYLYELAEQGKCDLNEIITIEYKDIQPGTGAIAKKKPEEFPLKLTVRELMREAIRSSDNTAMEKLRKKYDHTGYLPYATGLGLKYPQDVLRLVNGKITAVDAGIYAKAIYNYIQNGKYGNELYDDMINTTNPLIRSEYKIARKYGWAELSLHDMAIVYAKSPYVLAICTDASLGKESDNKLFAELSKAFERFHKKRYP